MTLNDIINKQLLIINKRQHFGVVFLFDFLLFLLYHHPTNEVNYLCLKKKIIITNYLM